MIAGGYYLKAKKIQESWIAHAPPHVREIWDWLLLSANYEDRRVGERTIKRGQCFTSYDEIREGLHWMVGWRKEKYSKWDCEKAMKVLTKATMVATTKTTRGIIITILNYDLYQNPKNYESHNEGHRKATRKPQTTDTIHNELNEYKEEKKKTNTLSDFVLPEWINPEIWEAFKQHRNSTKPKMTQFAEKLILNNLEKLKKTGTNPNDSLKQSIERGWKGVFPVKNPIPEDEDATYYHRLMEERNAQSKV